MDKFIGKMNEVRENVINKMKEMQEIIMTEDDKADFDTATKCFVCRKGFRKGIKKLETIAILLVNIEVVLMMIVILLLV